MVNFIAMAIPLFFLLIGIEALVGWIARKDYYRFNDSMNDLTMGTYDQVIGAFLKTVVFGGYMFLYTNQRLFDIDQASILMWVLCLLGYDFLYYWAHRASHEINVIWASHIPHHSSEEYNLSVALRQGAFQGCLFWIFYLPLAIIGFPPLMFIAMAQLDTLYQFWIHTRSIGKLGPLEWFLNTPSHHRVHHGQNPKYIDKNHAGILIIWDRMFGTFQEEEEEPVYGIVSPLRSWNPVWGQIHYWVYLFKMAWKAPRWLDKFLIWLMPPAWKPRGLETPPRSDRPVTRSEQKRYNPRVPLWLNFYVLAHYVLTIPVTVVFLFQEAEMTWPVKIMYAFFILLTLGSLGGVMELKRWALSLESVRISGASLGMAFCAYSGLPVLGLEGAPLAGFGAVHAAVFLPWLLAHARAFRYRRGLLPEEAAIGQAAPPSPEPTADTLQASETVDDGYVSAK